MLSLKDVKENNEEIYLPGNIRKDKTRIKCVD